MIKKFFYILLIILICQFYLIAQNDSTQIRLMLKNIDNYISANKNYDSVTYLFKIIDSFYQDNPQLTQNNLLYINYLLEKSKFYRETGKMNKAEELLKQCIDLSQKFHLPNSKIFAEYGVLKFYQGEYKQAIAYFKQAYDSVLKYNDYKKAELLLNLGITYKKIGDFNKALESYQLALNYINSSTKDNSLLITILNNIAILHKQQYNYDKALTYLQKALKVAQKTQNVGSIPLLQINIASIYLKIQEFQKAYQYLQQALIKLDTNGNTFYYIQALNLLGDYYKNTTKYNKALEKYLEVLNLQRKYKYLNPQIRTLSDLAELYQLMADSLNNYQYYNKSIQYAQEGLNISQKTHSLPYITKFFKILAKDYAKIKNYKKAYQYAINYIDSNNVLFNIQKTKALEELEAKYENEKQQQEIEKQKIIIEKQKIQQKRDQAIKRSLFAMSFMVIIIAFILYRGYRRKKHDNQIIIQKNLQLEQAYNEIQVQKEKIENIHKKLTDSINYAQRIQSAAMPKESELNSLFKEYFIIFKPLQVVSGDFYWAKKINDYIIFAVADCTGHGVPGAFVSMLGISLLNELTQKKEVINTAQLLEFMRENIKLALGQKNNNTTQFDGMDIAVCAYNTKTNILQYSGANRPIIIVSQDGILTEYKPVKNPIAYYLKEKNFRFENIEIKNNDIIYLFTDGITDQFNKQNQKFSKRQLKKLLLNIYKKTLKEQKIIIDKTISEWMKDTDQIDDITIMAVKLI